MTSYIIGAVRTPRSKGKVGKGALTAPIRRNCCRSSCGSFPRSLGPEVGDGDDLVTGAVSQVSEQGANISRNAVLSAEWPREVGGVPPLFHLLSTL